MRAIIVPLGPDLVGGLCLRPAPLFCSGCSLHILTTPSRPDPTAVKIVIEASNPPHMVFLLQLALCCCLCCWDFPP